MPNTSFDITTVCTAIAGLTITDTTLNKNLKIFDLDGIPDQIQARDCPCFFPNVTVGVWEMQPVQRMSFGSGGNLSNEAKKNIIYTLRWRLLYAPVGAGRTPELKGYIKAMALLTSAIITKFVSTAGDTLGGMIDLYPQRVSQAGTKEDPSGNPFHGVDFDFYVLEYTEV